MMQVERSVTISRHIKQVFAFVSNPDNNPRWQPDVIEHRKLTDGQMSVGTKFRHVSKFMGRRIEVIGRVTEYEPNRKIAFQVESGTLPYTIEYLMAPVNNATKFTYASVAQIDGLLKLTQPLMVIAAKRVIDGDLARLKELLEQ